MTRDEQEWAEFAQHLLNAQGGSARSGFADAAIAEAKKRGRLP